MTRVSNAGFECEHCETIGTFGIATYASAREGGRLLVEGQREDAQGLVHDPVFHRSTCPLVAAAKPRREWA